MKNWLVIANAARARVLEEPSAQHGRQRAYVHVADLVHPQSRQKGHDLTDERPGHVQRLGFGLSSTAYAAHTDPREREHDRFAREVAQLIDDGVAAGRCAGLVLIASSPFLGHLKARLGAKSKKAILRTVDADYTALDERELTRRLATDADEPSSRP